MAAPPPPPGTAFGAPLARVRVAVPVLLVLLGLCLSSPSTSSPTSMVVFVKEQCYQPGLDMNALRELVQTRAQEQAKALRQNVLTIKFVPRGALCGDQPGELRALLDALSVNTTRAVVGSFEAALCGVLDLFATLHTDKTIITWGCPQQELLPGAGGGAGAAASRVVRLLPPLAATVQGAVRIATYYRFRTAAIISSGLGWWQLTAQGVDLALRAADVEVRHRVLLPPAPDDTVLESELKSLLSDPVRVLVLCIPLRSPLWGRVLAMVDALGLVGLPASAVLALHPTSATPFMSHDPAQGSGPFANSQSTTFRPGTESTVGSPRSRRSVGNLPLSRTKSAQDEGAVKRTRGNPATNPVVHSTTPLSSRPQESVGNYRPSSPIASYVTSARPPGLDRRHLLPMFLPRANLSSKTQSSILVLTALDSDLKVEDAFLSEEGCPNRSCPQLEDHLELWHHIQRGWDVLTRPLAKVQDEPWEAGLVLLDWIQGGAESGGVRWRPLLQLQVSAGRDEDRGRWKAPRIESYTPRDWPRWKGMALFGAAVQSLDLLCDPDEEFMCAEETELLSSGARAAVLVAAIALLFLIAGIIATITRQQLLRKKMTKGPCKVLLTPNDFVFSHMPDARRVDEGMEAMLCCWLQQLQEFGGPEVDKPDLLKGSVGSLKSLHPPPGQGKSPGSSGSLARNMIVDSKARYNGDLVQLKELPVAGTFELKTKAMDILLLLHGLRHENLNPLLGCLVDTPRPALVLEYGSRGSLEDVLVQDEIKLDWSFRLSLLTDLVRGMRYLHSTPVRVHGRLTSRNCVIDARWLLKVTDYGLPAFYEAQGITPPEQSARGLLWTAPELLRDENLARKGTQPGDVYSFSIIMQEVVLRGEPFCILQLKPEEIIEKLKRPPPLIRPSVSKGAAPPEAINIMRQCWAELPDSRPDFNAINDQFKTLNHGRKANFVDTMSQLLEKYSNNLEDLIRERTEQLDCEKKKTEQLLNRMLPSEVADKLKMGQPVEPEDYQEVTIYFSDIVGFTAISCHSTPGQVVDLLNDLYTCFDATINAYNVYKVETIGDAYMVVGGLPVRVPDHADQVATMALDLLHQSGRFQIRHLPYTPLRLRIGLHTGPCCAGVVGLTMPRYCLFGDTVNTASRLESTGSAWRIHISEATKKKLDEVEAYTIEYRGITELKGKGFLPTYWLLGKKGFDKELPTPPPIEESHGLDESLLLPPKNLIPTSTSSNSTTTTSALSTLMQDTSNAAAKRRSFESCSSGEAANSLQETFPGHGAHVLDLTLGKSSSPQSQFQPDNLEKIANSNRIRVCASVDNEKTPTRRGSLQLATESVKIGLCTMSIGTEGRMGSRDLSEDTDVPSATSTLTPAPTPGSQNSVLPPTTRADTVPSKISFVTASSGITTTLSTSEVAVDLLGVSFLNPPATWRSSSSNLSGSRDAATHHSRPKKPAFVEEDLSSAFNHYRCLSPHDPPRLASLGSVGRGFLKRQFSLDRSDDQTGSGSGPGGPPLSAPNPRGLHKQNSAGAAHDLQRIEEVPTDGSNVLSVIRPRDLASLSSSESLA